MTYGCDVPLVLMNSFNTEEDTLQILRKYKGFNVNIFTFMQSRFPRINRDTLMPLTKSLADKGSDECFYPPGNHSLIQCHNSILLHYTVANECIATMTDVCRAFQAMAISTSLSINRGC